MAYLRRYRPYVELTSWNHVVTTLAFCPQQQKLYLKEILVINENFPTTIEAVNAQKLKHAWKRAHVENRAYACALLEQLAYNDATFTANTDVSLTVSDLAAAFEAFVFTMPLGLDHADTLKKELLLFPNGALGLYFSFYLAWCAFSSATRT